MSSLIEPIHASSGPSGIQALVALMAQHRTESEQQRTGSDFQQAMQLLQALTAQVLMPLLQALSHAMFDQQNPGEGQYGGQDGRGAQGRWPAGAGQHDPNTFAPFLQTPRDAVTRLLDFLTHPQSSEPTSGSRRDCGQQQGTHGSHGSRGCEGHHRASNDDDRTEAGDTDTSCQQPPSHTSRPDDPCSPAKPPAPTSVKVLDKTIVVGAGQTFDGHGALFKAGPKLGDGGQSESQLPLFQLENGAKLVNTQIQGADGIHCMGSATLDHVWGVDVGEDFMTMKGPGQVNVIGGGAYQASDKVFQVNAGGQGSSLTINGFDAENYGKLVRTNGGKPIDIDIKIENCRLENGHISVATTDSNGTFIELLNNQISGIGRSVVESPNRAHVTGTDDVSYRPFRG